jgi:hypothetical protein
MKKMMFILITVVVLLPLQVTSQERRALQAAELSYSAAQKDYKKKNYLESAQKYTIVVNSIPAEIDSRKHLEMRLESLISLVDIYFYKYVNIKQACEFLSEYNNTMSKIKYTGVLKGTDLLKYLKQEQDYVAKEQKQCDGYERIGGDMDKFRSKSFDKEFEKKFE